MWWDAGGWKGGVGTTVPLRQSREPTPGCTLLYRCSINEYERNGRMCGTVILRNTPASAQLSYLVTVIINNCANHTR